MGEKKERGEEKEVRRRKKRTKRKKHEKEGRLIFAQKQIVKLLVFYLKQFTNK